MFLKGNKNTSLLTEGGTKGGHPRGAGERWERRSSDRGPAEAGSVEPVCRESASETPLITRARTRCAQSVNEA